MKNNSYNLENVFFLKVTALLSIAAFLTVTLVFIEDAKAKDEPIITAEDKALSWQAIVSVDRKKKKLYAEGDIFCSDIDITDCLRIEGIRKKSLILEDVNSGEVITVNAGDRIPVKGTLLIFEKAIQMSAIEHIYHKPVKPVVLDDKKYF